MANNATFLGAKNVGNKSGNAAMSWSISGLNGNSATVLPANFAQLVQTLTGSGDWYKFIIDPVAFQGSFTFGEAKSMQLQICRFRAWFTAAATYFFPGRVIIYIPSTGQTLVFSYDDILPIQLNPTNAAALENENVLLPILLTEGSHIEVWMESDVNSNAIAQPETQITLTLFNFAIAPVKVS